MPSRLSHGPAVGLSASRLGIANHVAYHPVPYIPSRALAGQAKEEQEAAKEHGQRNGQAGALPVGEEASNAVPMSKRSLDTSTDSVDDSQFLEEYCPDTPEPARGKNKHSQS